MPPNIQVQDSAIDLVSASSSEKLVHYKMVDGREHYKVWLFLTGPRVPFVDVVTYTLHPSFDQPVREVPRTAANPNCTLILWTWGTFEVKVQVRGKQGELAEFTHTMRYDDDFELPGVKFVDDEPPKEKMRMSMRK